MSLVVIYTHAATMELNEVPQKTKVEVPYNPLYLYDLDTQRTLSKHTTELLMSIFIAALFTIVKI